MEIRFLLASARRGWLSILLLAVVGLALGTYVGAHSPKDYLSRASLDVTVPQAAALLNSSYTEDPNRYIATQIGILESDAIATSAARLVPGETKRSVEKETTVTQRGSSDIIDIVAKTTSASLSASIANALATTYRNQTESTLGRPLTTQITTLQAQLATLQSRLSVATSTGGTSSNQSLVGALETQYSQASQDLNQAQLAQRLDASSVTIFDQASAAPGPEARHISLKAGIGLAAGLVVGYLLALVFVLLRPKLIRPEDVEDVLGLSIAADLPFIPTRQRLQLSERHRLELAHADLSPAVAEWDQEMLRLGALVQASKAKGRYRSVLVTSVERSDAVSTVAGDLADLFRRTGMAVELTNTTHGSAGDAAQRPQRSRSGNGQMSVDSVLTSERWLRNVDRFTELVVFDGSPLSESADSIVLARNVDVLIVVFPLPNETRRRLVRSLRASLVDSDAQVLFVTCRTRRATAVAPVTAGITVDRQEADVASSA